MLRFVNDEAPGDSFSIAADGLFVLNNVLFVKTPGANRQVAWWDEKRLAWIGTGPCAGKTYTYITTEGN